MNIERQFSNFLSADINSWQIYSGISAGLILGAAYTARHQIVKGLKTYRHETLHRNFFDHFVPLKKKNGEPCYPKCKWQNCILGGKTLKRAFLEIRELYIPNIESISSKLELWSTEFGAFFSRVERGSKPDIYKLWRSGFEFYPIVAPRDVYSAQSNKGSIALGIQDNLQITRLALFNGTESHTRIAAQSGWGKTYLISWVIGEAVRACPDVRVLLVTSKGRGIVKKYVGRPIEIVNPLVSLKKVHDRIVQFYVEALDRLRILEETEQEYDLTKLTLIVIDEATDVLFPRSTKPTDDEETLRQSITVMLGAFASKMRSLGYHVVCASQSSALSDYPLVLRSNCHNLIVGQIDSAFYSVIFEGAPKTLFAEPMKPGDRYVKTPYDDTRRVRVVHPGAHELIATQKMVS